MYPFFSKKEALDKIDLFFRCQIIHFDAKELACHSQNKTAVPQADDR